MNATFLAVHISAAHLMEFILVHFARPVDLVLSIWCTKCGASISLQLIWCFIAIAENPAEQFFRWIVGR